MKGFWIALQMKICNLLGKKLEISEDLHLQYTDRSFPQKIGKNGEDRLIIKQVIFQPKKSVTEVRLSKGKIGHHLIY
jgi:hypothetical protein